MTTPSIGRLPVSAYQEKGTLPSNISIPSKSKVSVTDEETHVDIGVVLRRRKYNTRWKQQRHIAFLEEHTAWKVLLVFIPLGGVFVLLGFLCYLCFNAYPPPIKYDYTNCADNKTGLQCSPGKFKSTRCKCVIEIEIKNEELANSETVAMYYELSNFHQNLREYRKDVDWNQLRGNIFLEDNLPVKSKTCAPVGGKHSFVYPCGKIANSYFNDEFTMFDSSGEIVTLDKTGISWPQDICMFKNPENWTTLLQHYSLPGDWNDDQKASFINGSSGGVEDEGFIVWMRIAAFKRFWKKYAYIKGLQTGKYLIEINYRYEVKSFGGTKAIVIATEPGSHPFDMFFFVSFGIVGLCMLVLGPLLFLLDFSIRKIVERLSAKRDEERERSIPNPTLERSNNPSVRDVSSVPIDLQQHASENMPPIRSAVKMH